MNCVLCDKKIERYIFSGHKKRNKGFYCDRKCYLEHINRDKIENSNYFQNIDDENKAYWLGFIAADGSLNKNGISMQIGLSIKDKNHLIKMGKIFDKEVVDYVSKRHNKSHKACRLCVSSKTNWNNLNRLGVNVNKTFEKENNLFKNIPQKHVRHFIRGYFDGDGCIYVSKDRKNICTFSMVGSPYFIYEVKSYLIKELGLSDTKLESRDNCVVLRWTGRVQCGKMHKYLYKDASVFLERKKKKFDSCFVPNSKSSLYRGVSWHKNNNKWLSSLHHDGKRLNLGYYDNEKDAALAYDRALLKYNKPKYKLNLVECN